MRADRPQPARRRARPIVGLAVAVLGAGLLAAALLLSLMVGATITAPGEVWRALTAPDGSETQIAVTNTRLPRTVVAAVVGATLAVAGALTQSVTRNGLADPSILGISWGAALAAVAGQVVFGVTQIGLVGLALSGAAVAALVVVTISLLGRDRLADDRLVVAGAAVSGLLAAVVQGILVVNRQSLEVARRWLAGSLSGAGWEELETVAPVLVLGFVGAALIARPLATLALGDEVATGLGVRTGWVKIATVLAVVTLAGSSVALAGPIVLVGLVVPHAARRMCTGSLGLELVACALLGAVLVLASDIVARLLIAPEELPVGIVTAVIGAPWLLYLARKQANPR